ncbi:cytidine and deoxycytidylate deaminase zinc-binding domain-containing protein [Hirsutella rhossiliensis]|uniref:Cytidine and deoxycytidylate deaminase zinc-binding domain-containing protein n=1 Tax=Hirsutella rhossiliensis TaxID=111463 RepID=A0A9P8MNU7_9HYPO|nr:cytidine and deoxycytidylate deaminase zinc-binding domain-containing protein [Hirsutella rhossiliensis]KAH0958913.1 cytidine and deoxycytidylate deaminase zinc-binding domain-containing protein [Hirsutella rhossiliensis]
MALSTLAAAQRALKWLFCSAQPAAAQDNSKGGSEEEEGGGGDSLRRAVEEAQLLANDDQSEQHNHDNNRHSSSGHIHSLDNNQDAAAAEMGDYIVDKENIAPAAADVAGVTAALGQLKLASPKGELVRQPFSSSLVAREAVVGEDAEVVREREQNLRFIGEALDMARLALRTNETPVGCVLVHKGQMIAKGMNATNVTRNGTRHAELMAISALLSVTSDTGPRTTSLRPKQQPPRRGREVSSSLDSSSLDSRSGGDAAPPDQGNEDGSKGHLYPYGQKLHASGRVDRRILHDSVLYVTVEPCVMCASLLRQFGIKKVYFGAVNDKFGGTGGVFSIHANSLPVGADGSPTASAHPLAPPRQQSQLPDSSGTLGTSYPPGGGDGGNVEPGYEIEGGWGRDEAVGLLRRFYVQENGRAPVPRKKEGRAARLAAMIEKDGTGVAAADAAAPGAVPAGGGGGGAEGPDEATTTADQQPSPGSVESRKENLAPVDDDGGDDDDDDDDEGVSEGKAESSSDDDGVDNEFYLGLAERARHRGNYAP